MRASRRRFLAAFGLALLAVGAVAWPRRMAVARWLAGSSLPPGRTGALRDGTAATLRSAVLALLDDRVEPGHYLECFRWRAEHVAGARELYERFEAAVDRAARRAGRDAFRSAPAAEVPPETEPTPTPGPGPM